MVAEPDAQTEREREIAKLNERVAELEEELSAEQERVTELEDELSEERDRVYTDGSEERRRDVLERLRDVERGLLTLQEYTRELEAESQHNFYGR